MIEKTVLYYLNDNLPVSAHMEKPKTPTGEYVLIEKTGGSRTNHINSATLAIQSYADSLYRAAALNDMVKAVMCEITELDNIVGVSLDRDYNFTDTETKKYRYQAICSLTYY